MTLTLFKHNFFKSTLVWLLAVGTIVASCSKDDNNSSGTVTADKAALLTALNTAKGLRDNTVEGTKPGQYETGSKAALIAILNAADSVYSSASPTQASVNNSTVQLNAAIAAYQAHLITEIDPASLVGFWKMNGNPADSSGKGNNGVLTAGHAFYGAGTVTSVADRFGRAGMAYHFDKGANIEIPYKAELNPAQMSFSVWIKWSSTGRTVNPNTYTMLAMNRWNGYKFQLQDTHLPFYTVKVARPDTTIYDRATDDGFSIEENQWRNLVVTFKSGTMTFYINGDPVKTWDNTSADDKKVPGNAITLPTPMNLVIGQDMPTDKYQTVDGDFQVAWGGFFTGDMDDVMFYKVALDQTQVKSIYNNQKSL